MYTIVFMTQVQKDAKKLDASALKQKSIVYEVIEESKITTLYRMWTHYE